jgi:hypothetical protein
MASAFRSTGSTDSSSASPSSCCLTLEGQAIFLTEPTGDRRPGGAADFVMPDVDSGRDEFTTRA